MASTLLHFASARKFEHERSALDFGEGEMGFRGKVSSKSEKLQGET